MSTLIKRGLYKIMLDKNIKSLDKIYPGIEVLINKKKEELFDKDKIEIVASNDKGILKVKSGEKSLYLMGKRDPITPAKNQISLLGKIEYSAPVFFVGLGNIYYLEELLKVVDKNNVILIYEPSFRIFYELLKKVELSKIISGYTVALIVEGINSDGLEQMISSMIQGDKVPIMKQFVLPNYEQLFPNEICEYKKKLVFYVKNYGVNVFTRIRFSNVIGENVFQNVKYVKTGYRAGQLQKAIPTDIPAIVVSAGPSLNNNIEELRKAKNKAFIIAVDTAVRPLLKAGIIPDMFAIVDGKKPLSLVELEEAKTIPLITTVDAAKEVLNYHEGKKFFYDEGYEYVNHLFEINKKGFESLPIGGSVATQAFSLVCHLGFKTIILVGQDLALTGNKTHADGTFKEKMQIVDTKSNKMVPGNYEELVPTREDFDNYRIWFEFFIGEWKKINGISVINATEGGAKIAGTDIMTLKDAIEENCLKEVNIQEGMDKLSPAFTKEEQQRIVEFFHDTPKEIHKIVELAREGIKLY